MSISSMRWRAASVFITAGGVAAAVLALAVPAGASTGTTEISPEQAGYTATGARFQNIDARVFLRQPAQYAGEVRRYGQSVQLWSSGYVVVAGVSASTSGSAYPPTRRSSTLAGTSCWPRIPMRSGAMTTPSVASPRSAPSPPMKASS